MEVGGSYCRRHRGWYNEEEIVWYSRRLIGWYNDGGDAAIVEGRGRKKIV